MTNITNNQDLNNFVFNLNGTEKLFAIKTKNLVRVFDNESEFNNSAKETPEAVQGEFSAYNFVWYRF